MGKQHNVVVQNSDGGIGVHRMKQWLRENPQDLAQILAYMGSISETETKSIRGILVAGEFHKRVELASRAIPNLRLQKYSFQFSFGDVG